MDTNDKLLELVEFVESARAMPLSSSVLLNKQDLLERIDEIRQGLPSTMSAADEIIAMRDSIIADARSRADLIIDDAKSEQARLVADHTVLAVARNEAERTRAAAHEAAVGEKRDVDDYIDAKLAHVEMVAERMLDTARAGRKRLQGTTSYDALAATDEPERDELPAAAGFGDPMPSRDRPDGDPMPSRDRPDDDVVVGTFDESFDASPFRSPLEAASYEAAVDSESSPTSNT